MKEAPTPISATQKRGALVYYFVLLLLFVGAIWATAAVATPILSSGDLAGSTSGGLRGASRPLAKGYSTMWLPLLGVCCSKSWLSCR